ncbi:MAG: glycogen synthase GlgA [Planctomycetes bacterium]|nr:glycogen synthase GlgA [Planctomycetota bacterium]
MRVLMVASEAVPFAKTGGLADVAGALPGALARLGCDVTLVIPAYREVFAKGLSIEPTGLSFEVPIGTRRPTARILRGELPGSGVPVVFVANDECFDRPTLYGGAEDYPDNAERFIFFARAALEFAGRQDRPFDILHCHDWQAGLVPAYQKLVYRAWPMLSGARSVITIHNMAYQGLFWHWDMLLTGFNWKYFNWQQMEFYGQLSFLKTGLVFADAISTVSPTYAREIQRDPGGCGLEGVLAARSDSLTGIVNGIDTTAWNPQTDRHIPRGYGSDDAAEGKAASKTALAARLGRNAVDPRPLVGLVGRLVEQKGIDLVIEMLGRMASVGRARFVILGTGSAETEEALRRVSASFPGAVDVVIGFDEEFAHLLFAAADIMLVPSRYEPCGLTQLYALRYGTIPVVRATGGLVDTVVDATPEALATGRASGFVFDAFDSLALEHAVERALAAHADRAMWAHLVRRVMAEDWSWETSAREYLRLFERVRGLPSIAVT